MNKLSDGILSFGSLSKGLYSPLVMKSWMIQSLLFLFCLQIYKVLNGLVLLSLLTEIHQQCMTVQSMARARYQFCWTMCLVMATKGQYLTAHTAQWDSTTVNTVKMSELTVFQTFCGFKQNLLFPALSCSFHVICAVSLLSLVQSVLYTWDYLVMWVAHLHQCIQQFDVDQVLYRAE